MVHFHSSEMSLLLSYWLVNNPKLLYYGVTRQQLLNYRKYFPIHLHGGDMKDEHVARAWLMLHSP